MNMNSLMQGYLFAFLFWIAVPLGSMGLCMLHYLTGGRWGKGLRPFWEAALPTIPWLALFFIPLALGYKEIYPWAHPHHGEGHHAVSHFRQIYLTGKVFIIRGFVYFAIWSFLSVMLVRLGHKYRDHEHPPHSLQILSGVGMALYALTLTFASVDWAMSLSPEWYSTIYGLIFMVGQGLTALSFGAFMMWRLSAEGKVRNMTSGHFHDLGNLMLAFTMLWAYVALSQFLIIWGANIPEEVPWYLARSKGGWEVQGILNVFLQFFVPFFALLMKSRKTDPRSLGLIAGWIFLMRISDLFWMVKPSYAPAFSVSAAEVVCLAGLGAVWIFMWNQNFKAAAKEIEPEPEGAHHH